MTVATERGGFVSAGSGVIGWNRACHANQTGAGAGSSLSCRHRTNQDTGGVGMRDQGWRMGGTDAASGHRRRQHGQNAWTEANTLMAVTSTNFLNLLFAGKGPKKLYKTLKVNFAHPGHIAIVHSFAQSSLQLG